METGNCACGELGYEGIFVSVLWKCPKCGKINHWKFKETKEVKRERKQDGKEVREVAAVNV